MYHPCVTSGPHTFPHGLFTFVSDRVLFITPCTASYYRGEGVVSSFIVLAIKTKYMQYSKRTRLNIRVGVEMCVCVCVWGGGGVGLVHALLFWTIIISDLGQTRDALSVGLNTIVKYLDHWNAWQIGQNENQNRCSVLWNRCKNFPIILTTCLTSFSYSNQKTPHSFWTMIC